MELRWYWPLPRNKSNMGLIDHMINYIDTIVSLEVDLTSRVIFNYTPPVLISTLIIFNPQSFMTGVAWVHCLYVAVRGAPKIYMHMQVGIIIVSFRIKLLEWNNRFKEYFNLGTMVCGCLRITEVLCGNFFE